jgi:hypothetical protein
MIRTTHEIHTRWTLAIALLLLVLTPMVAQAQQSDSSQDQQTNEARTRPAADSIAPGSGLTIRATVKEVRDSQIVLDTPTGVRFVQVTDQTRKPVNLAAGQDVAIDYTRTDQGVMIANDVRLVSAESQPMAETTTQAQTETMTDERSEQTESGSMESDSTKTADTGTMDESMDNDRSSYEDMGSDAETEQYASNQESGSTMANDSEQASTRDRDALPTTASGLPLAALLGLIALGGAVAFRTFRS